MTQGENFIRLEVQRTEVHFSVNFFSTDLDYCLGFPNIFRNIGVLPLPNKIMKFEVFLIISFLLRMKRITITHTLLYLPLSHVILYFFSLSSKQFNFLYLIILVTEWRDDSSAKSNYSLSRMTNNFTKLKMNFTKTKKLIQ